MKTIELNNKKDNFFKRFWYGLTRPNKYRELAQDGLKKAIRYIFVLMLITATCFTISTVFTLTKYISNGIITFEEGKTITTEYLFGYYFTTYFLSTILYNFIYLLILVLIGWIVSKIFKISLKIKEIICIGIYSFTLSSVIYVIYSIVNYFIEVPSNIVNQIYMISMYIYFFMSLLFIRKNNKINSAEE